MFMPLLMNVFKFSQPSLVNSRFEAQPDSLFLYGLLDFHSEGGNVSFNHVISSFLVLILCSFPVGFYMIDFSSKSIQYVLTM